ncbi:MAG TPA: hypothetical protein ENN09_00975, partial [Planctomycetes bacterium]|nr:hypothetical protein [Planctomycetota bacterium]
AGRPVEAELSLSLVDKALLDKYPDPVVNIVKFFEDGLKRRAEFLAYSSITFERRGEKQRIAAEVLEEQRRVHDAAARSELRDKLAGREAAAAKAAAPPAPSAPAMAALDRGVAFAADADGMALMEMEDAKMEGRAGGAARKRQLGYARPAEKAAVPPTARREMPIGAFWIGSAVTGRDGRAEVKISVPERTSRYRVQLRGVSPDTLLAELETEAVVKRDLFVDLKIPGFLLEGDKVRPVITVHNTSDFKGAVGLKLELDAAGRKRSFSFSVNLDGAGVAEQVSDAYEVPLGETLRAVLTAEAGGTLLDKIEKTSAIRPWGVEERAARSGSSTQDVSFTLALPPAVRHETASLELALFPGVEAAIVDLALNPSVQTDDISVKASAARLLALVSLAETFGAGRLPQEQVERINNAARAAASALLSSQMADGSWAWTPSFGRSAPVDHSTTAWAVLGLHRAVKAGLISDGSARDRGVNFLQRTVSRGGETTVHLECLYALAASGSGDFSALNRFYRTMASLPAERRILLGLAFAAMDKQEYARGIAETVAREINVLGARRSVRAEDVDGMYVKSLALLLLGRSGGFEKDAARLAEAIRSDLAASGASGAPRWLALAALAEASGPAALERPAFVVDVSVNDKPAGRYRTAPGAAPSVITLKGDELASSSAKIQLRYQGRGTLAYRALLKGFSPVVQERRLFHYGPTRETFFHSPALYQGRRLLDSSMDVSVCAYDDHVEDELAFAYFNNRRDSSPGDYVVITRWLPAGAVLDKTSLPSNAVFTREAAGRLTMVFRGNPSSFRIRLLPYCPGEYRALPVEYASAERPGDYERLSGERRLSVLAPGEKDRTPYRWSDGERLAFGKAHFNDGEYSAALEHLSKLSVKERQYDREFLRNLLWIYCMPEHYKPAQVIDIFEILAQRHPSQNIPYEKLLVIGKAYHDSGENEAACYLWRATLESSFRDDIPVAAELETAGEYLRAVEYLQALFWDYPDLPAVSQALYGLSQDLYAHKDRARELAAPDGKKGSLLPEHVIGRALAVLNEFLALFGDLPYADEAVFSLLNACLELRAHDACLSRALAAVDLYPESKYRDRFRYIAALAAFHLGRYE